MFRKTTYKQIVSCVVGLSALAAVSLVNAATVSLTPSPQTLEVGDTFNITASGTGFDADVTFLDMTLTWDASFLTLNTTDTTILADAVALGFFDGGFTSIDTSVPGSLNLSFDTDFLTGAFIDTTTSMGIFDFFTLEFMAISPIASTAIMWDEGILGGFLDGGGMSISVVEVGADIMINPVSAVPVPAAVWLFGSGLIGLVGVSRRRKV